MPPALWEDTPVEKISEQVERQAVWGEKSTLARMRLAQGAHVSKHSYESEQITCLLSGAMRMRLGDTELRLHAGEVLVIPSAMEHEVWVLEDTVVLDFFAPAREDWRRGRSQYLAGKRAQTGSLVFGLLTAARPTSRVAPHFY